MLWPACTSVDLPCCALTTTQSNISTKQQIDFIITSYTLLTI
uniref:Uncharacterized protein n=1 Tax=Ciona intestinalis TaxID=7719 RepID=H2XRE7_CIOIN